MSDPQRRRLSLSLADLTFLVVGVALLIAPRPPFHHQWHESLGWLSTGLWEHALVQILMRFAGDLSLAVLPFLLIRLYRENRLPHASEYALTLLASVALRDWARSTSVVQFGTRSFRRLPLAGGSGPAHLAVLLLVILALALLIWKRDRMSPGFRGLLLLACVAAPWPWLTEPAARLSQTIYGPHFTATNTWPSTAYLLILRGLPRLILWTLTWSILLDLSKRKAWGLADVLAIVVGLAWLLASFRDLTYGVLIQPGLVRRDSFGLLVLAPVIVGLLIAWRLVPPAVSHPRCPDPTTA